MREKGDEGSMGRAGGVDVGVTRPKRRGSRCVWFLCFTPPFFVFCEDKGVAVKAMSGTMGNPL